MQAGDYMTFKALQHGSLYTFSLVTKGNAVLPSSLVAGAACNLYRPDGERDILLHVLALDKPGTGPDIVPVRGVTRQDHRTLEHLVDQDLPRVVWVAKRSQGNKNGDAVTVTAHVFPSALFLPEPIVAGLDEKALQDLHRVIPHVGEDFGAVLRRRLLLPPGRPDGKPRAVICASPDRALEKQRAFRVLGDGLVVDLARDDGGKLLVKRIRTGTGHRPRDGRPLVLAEMAIRFTDVSLAAEYRGQARATLEQLAEKGESYLAFWKAYNDLEQRVIARQAQAFGWLRYEKRQPTERGWVFHIPFAKTDNGANRVVDRVAQVREEHLTLEASSDVPQALLAARSRVSSHSATTVEPQAEAPSGEEPNGQDLSDDDPGRVLEAQRELDHGFMGTYVAHQSRAGVLLLDLEPLDEDTAETPPEKGVLFVSLLGDTVRLKRREEAEAAIRLGNAPMPALGMILEDQTVPAARFRRTRVKRSWVREIFGSDPTQAQLDAIDIALNTPDIAVIQGPFGTGKTQVITAIEELLARKNESENLPGSILLTSFQHDAVENAASRTIVLGLPAVKVGGRRGERPDIDPARVWRKEQVTRLSELLEARADSDLVRIRREAARMALTYARNPGETSRVTADLRRLHDLATGHVPSELLDALVSTAQDLERHRHAPIDDEDRPVLRKAVFRLRVQATAFMDDGPLNARKLLIRADRSPLLSKMLSSEDNALLERAADWAEETAPDFLPRLEELQNRLLEALESPELPPVTPVANPEVEALFARVAEALGEREARSADGVTRALADFLEDLENDPVATTETLRAYTAVLAATCQQTAGRPMRVAKDAVNPGDRAWFDSVVIDEAARANPLDLFIPMARARRRIVLVGDHKQLPHLLEPDLEQELERTVNEMTLKALRESLFQRLYERLQERRKRDGIRRTIMLDTQFRMHPKLGGFLSEHFYDGALKSGRPAEAFAHTLPGYDGERYQDTYLRSVDPERCMAWLHVPLGHGTETRGRSKKRTVEARAVAHEVRRLLDACDHSPDERQRNLTFGVIAFYRAQVDALWEALLKERVAEYVGGRVQVRRAYRSLEDGRERLRVGTVDAFQGKEFDVVILSMTRANDFPENSEADLRRRYGHLMLPNRLNVAMGRQKRLLIVAGAKEMVTSPKAKQAVPALADFYTACTRGERS